MMFDMILSAASGKSDREIIFGVDPGLLRTGYAFVRGTPGHAELLEAGVVRMSPKAPLAARLVELEASLGQLLETQRPSALYCESLYAHYKHPRTAILMGHARGVILCLAGRSHVRVRSLAATHVKKWITGSGRAGKRQVQQAVAATLGLTSIPEPSDVADAIAIALAGLHAAHAERCGAAAEGARR